jgi:hypothetical protein
MSGTYPTTKKPSVLNFISNRPTTVDYTLSGKRSVKLSASQYFSFTITMPPMKRSDFMEYYSFLVKQTGSFETFTFTSPLNNQGLVDANDTVLVNGVHAIGDTTIDLDGFTASQTGAFKAGDIINFANHNKAYMITADVNSSGSAAATVTIEPPLQSALSDNESVNSVTPNFTVSLVQDDLLYSTDSRGLFALSFDVREVL